MKGVRNCFRYGFCKSVRRAVHIYIVVVELRVWQIISAKKVTRYLFCRLRIKSSPDAASPDAAQVAAMFAVKKHKKFREARMITRPLGPHMSRDHPNPNKNNNIYRCTRV